MIKNVANKEKQEIQGVIPTGRCEIRRFTLPLPQLTTHLFRASSQEVTPACLTMPRECESSLSFKSHLMVQQTTINTDCISPLSSPSNILRSPPY